MYGEVSPEKTYRNGKLSLIVASLSLFVAILALILSFLVAFYNYKEKNTEKLIIKNVIDSDNLIFDEKCLKKNIKIFVYNDSKITTSISEIIIERGESDIFSFKIEEGNLNSINIESGCTEDINLIIEYKLDNEQIDYFENKYNEGDEISEAEYMIIKEKVLDCEYSRFLFSRNPFLKVSVSTTKGNLIMYRREKQETFPEFFEYY